MCVREKQTDRETERQREDSQAESPHPAWFLSVAPVNPGTGLGQGSSPLRPDSPGSVLGKNSIPWRTQPETQESGLLPAQAP